MQEKLADMRKQYVQAGLDISDCVPDPINQFEKWIAEARDNSPGDWFEANAMTLATSDKAGQVTSRIVLLKDIRPSGFVFFTNYESAKGQQIASNAQGSVTFYWPHLERQVRAVGQLEKISREESETYFHSRPVGSQLGAIASRQSTELSSREEIENAYNELEKQYADKVIPMPEWWGGYLLKLSKVEFWQGRANRLHDRIEYRSENDSWEMLRLAP